ncbi:MAG TPA: NADH-quinone oxidoreductase subunit J [Gemmatimonadales bacterium]|nr:NADH-quinone oxidoreductase subunit J [Gemmatimonadales bacterium]
MTETIFWVFAVVAVVAALACILQRNPVAAALCLVQVMFSLAAIFVLLDAQFIAAIQVLVYAGAVMVLFLFVIMLLNLGRKGSDLRGPAAIAATLVAVGLLVAELWLLWAYTPERLAAEVRVPAALAGADAIQSATAQRGVVGAIAAPVFQTYLIPFEITSVLLLAAIVGAVVLAKRRV